MPCGQSARSMDGAIALTFIMLEAVSPGLQTCWLGGFDSEKLKAELELPDNYVVIGGLAPGYPAGKKIMRPKKNIDETVIYKS